MADLSARDVEKVKFAFSIYDFEGNDTMDAFYMGECLRALNLNPTLAVLEKVGILATSTSSSPLVSVRRMMYAELEHILISLGERLEKEELLPVLTECCPPEDDEGFIPYEPFVKKICEGVKP
ncbi:myosin light chain 1 isoform X1 [Hyalella azteca]|uniref:Myosin light chain 1 isoform X1 n=1 Tax=Hyalella azteca TaxID=294128 RepID=A0A8B7NHB1_HYAAZ|nr:myosin light chain 1 isoform X1 [Hyalella azteca]